MAGQCQRKRADGRRCKGRARDGSRWCTFHQPGPAQREARRKGGRARARKAAVLPPATPDAPLADLADVARLLAETVNQVRRGELDPKAGNCLAVLCGQLMRALEGADIDRRLEDLEAAAAIDGPRRIAS